MLAADAPAVVTADREDVRYTLTEARSEQPLGDTPHASESSRHRHWWAILAVCEEDPDACLGQVLHSPTRE